MLEVVDLGHSYREGTALENVSFRVDPGELVCVVGPSGCGKSTLLRCVAGLQRPSSGSVWLRGQRVDGVPTELAVVFQDYSRSLLAWKTVAGNVGFPLHTRERSKSRRRERVMHALSSVGLSHVADKYPWQLSGGMQQRVAIARALAYRPALLLMDEPFASVDAQTRADLEDLLLQVRAEHDMTIVLVTHDIDESVYLSDRVLVLSASPAVVVDDIKVGLPRDREQITTRASDAFVHLRSDVARLLCRVQ